MAGRMCSSFPSQSPPATRSGLEIWCIENHHLVPVPKSCHGKFFCGSSYLILNTTVLRSGLPCHDLHYWLGKDSNAADSTLASDKAIELDAALFYHAVQYREVQGHESEKFLSYFKPCIIPLEGAFSTKTGRAGGETFHVRLFVSKGEHVVRIKEVPFARSSLSHDDVIILDTEAKIYLFCGRNSSIQERAKALEVVDYIKDNNHGGKCGVITVEDGKFGDSEIGEFWSLFGGYAPISKTSPFSNHIEPEKASVQLLWVARGKMCHIEDKILKRELLCSDRCYVLDCHGEIFVWMGRHTSLTERKESIMMVEDTVRSQGRSSSTSVVFLTEGFETTKFTSYFDAWPLGCVQSLYEEGRGKVAEIFKQHGFDVKEIPPEDCEPHIDCAGTLKVWRVSCHGIMPAPEMHKIFGGECYVLQYTYLVERKENSIFYVWIGKGSKTEDRIDATTLMCSKVASTSGQSVMAQVFEGKETVQFFSIFQSLVIYQGPEDKRLANKCGLDEALDSVALFRVQGTGPHNMQAIQVAPVASSLNSSFSYILEIGAFVFVWIGSLSSAKDQDMVDRMLLHVNPEKQPIQVKEGSEPHDFWSAIGGKTEYPKQKESRQMIGEPKLFVCMDLEDVRLFCFSMFKLVGGRLSVSGDLEVKEIYNFTQDDMATEDVLILNCYSEIYVWIGRHAKLTSKGQAFSIAKKFINHFALLEGMSLETAVHIINEGHEPKFFTRFFSWDALKASLLGNSFERKLALAKSLSPRLDAHGSLRGLRVHDTESSRHTQDRSTSSDRIASRSVSPAFDLTSSKLEFIVGQQPSTPSIVRTLFHQPSVADTPHENISPEVAVRTKEHPTAQNGKEVPPVVFEKFPYENLRVSSKDPAAGVDVTKREAYLSVEEFLQVFGMTKGAFYSLPKWRQDKLKMQHDLF